MDGLGRRTAPSLIYQYAGACLVPLDCAGACGGTQVQGQGNDLVGANSIRRMQQLFSIRVCSIADWREHHLTLSAVKGL